MTQVALKERPAVRRFGNAYAIFCLVPPVLLVVYLVGSLLFTGGQVSEAMDPIWDQVLPYPLFAMPAVVLIVPAAISLILAVCLVSVCRAEDVLRLRGSIGPTAAAIMSSIGFAALVPDGGSRYAYGGLGDQWVAAALFAASLVVLLVGIALARVRHTSGRTAKG